MSRYSLVADVGGTNARFALVAEGSRALEQVQTLACADYENLDAACLEYFRQAGVSGITRASLAFACPVQVETIRMTNNHWVFTRDMLRSRLGLEQLELLNDFTAMALGMLEVRSDELQDVGAGQGLEGAPRLVIGPGTGLGVSALVPSGGKDNRWIALATEGGHVSFAPTDEVEVEVWRSLKQQFGRVSVERILCGQGLVNLYRALAQYHQQPFDERLTPADITAAGLAGGYVGGSLAGDSHAGNSHAGNSLAVNSLAVETLQRFCRILGEQAGDAVLTLGARGGVYLCGGILPRMADFLQQSAFRQGFEAKGRFEGYLREVPVWLCTAKHPGLLGAAAALR
ncbi:glucokinase [Nitrincola alkalilacustris]|uniref:glucokinase n=1 Tax=Nitrincola alkalilacustris TaxID=1571224 RepID=UPI00124BFC7D|nr:glucokinase [Nitrincola alkalilacustris]